MARLEEAALLRAALEEELRTLRLEVAQRSAETRQLHCQLDGKKRVLEEESLRAEELQQQLQFSAVNRELLSRLPTLELGNETLRKVGGG